MLLLGPGPLLARSYALLVGVSDYDDSIGLADLRGPANDVRLLRDVLSARADFDIRVLADGVEGGQTPTRAAILGAFDALVEAAQDGDFVYVHLSGHGTQQADRSGDETDGMDEVFLPSDTARAEPGTSVIPNAIVDEEFGSRVAALRAKAVDVWFVLDSCHSGSGLRAGSPRTAARFVDPGTLGVTVEARPQPATTSAIEGPGSDDLPGKYLAFYSAQSSEVAREIEIGTEGETGWYGLFTSRLAARLQSDATLSYRQLFQAVLADMNDDAVPGGARLQTPLWDGNLIDATVFGGGDTVGLRQFAVDSNRLQAGKLHGLTDNSVVALVSDAAAPADEILSFAQLEKTGVRSAALATVSGDCVASVSGPCARLGPLPEGAKFARLVAKPLDAVLRIAAPVDLSTGAPLAQDHPLSDALRAAIVRTNETRGTNIRLDSDANVLAGAAQGALWFGPKLPAGNSPTGLRWSPDDGPLDPLLERIARAEQMADMFGSIAGTPSLLFPSPVKIEAQRISSDAASLSRTVPDDLYAECDLAMQSPTVDASLPAGQALKQCDVLAFGAQGVVQGPARDVNRIYIDSQYCASAEYQRVEGVSQPAILGEPIGVCADCPEGNGVQSKAGVERLFVVVTEAKANREVLNLSGLINTCATTDAATRATGVAQVDGFLAGLGQQDATRGGMGAIGISKIWVEKFTWQVLPRREALVQAGVIAQKEGE